MGRREFVALSFMAWFAAAAAWPLAAQAQGLGMCGWIGVRVKPMTPAFAASLGMVQPYGALFERPRPGGPAAKAGIEAYDVVTAINGSPLRSWRDFAPTISAFAPGTTIALTTWRSKQLIDVRVALGRTGCSSALRKPR